MSAARAIAAFFDVEGRAAAGVDRFVADRNNNNSSSSAVAEPPSFSVDATRLWPVDGPRSHRNSSGAPRTGPLTSVHRQQPVGKAEPPVEYCRRAQNSFNMKLRRKSGR